jgi:hypothetical protein
VKEARYLIGERRKNEELRRRKVWNKTTTLSRQLNHKGWQTLVTKLDRAALTKAEANEAQERHFDAVDEVLKNKSNSLSRSYVSSKSNSNESMSDARGASGYCLASMAQEDDNDEPEPGEDVCVDHINDQIMQYKYCLRWLSACKSALNKSRARKKRSTDPQHKETRAKRSNTKGEATALPTSVITHTRKCTSVRARKRLYTCSICDRTLSNKANLSRHMLTHEPGKPICCDKCRVSFTSNPDNKPNNLSSVCPSCTLINTDNNPNVVLIPTPKSVARTNHEPIPTNQDEEQERTTQNRNVNGRIKYYKVIGGVLHEQPNSHIPVPTINGDNVRHAGHTERQVLHQNQLIFSSIPSPSELNIGLLNAL